MTKHNSNYENTPVLSLQFSNQPLSGRLRKATARPQRKGKRLAWSNEDLRMLLRFVIVACVKARKSSKLTLLRSVCGYGCCNFSNLQISLSKILKIHTTTCTTQKYVSFLGTIFNCNFNWQSFAKTTKKLFFKTATHFLPKKRSASPTTTTPPPTPTIKGKWRRDEKICEQPAV